MPLWCTCTDSPQPPQNVPSPHHRIVRIPPGECVVLNSAERAPFLLVIEVLNADLDFDPQKRCNKAMLQKIVNQETEKKGASRDFAPFSTSPSTTRPKILPEIVNASDAVLGRDTPDIPDAPV